MTAPDYGETVWATGLRVPQHVLFVPLSITDHGSHREVTGMVYLDQQSLCITVSTDQTQRDILRHNRRDNTMWASGRLADEVVTGVRGERYRMLIGKVGL